MDTHNKQNQKTDAFCVIAGGGPVGLTTAIELGRRGVKCIVLNDQKDTPKHPKSNAIGARTMEHFRRFGIAQNVRHTGMPADHPTDVTYVTRLGGLEIGRLELPSANEAMALVKSNLGDYPGPEAPHRLSQIYLEKILLDHSKALPNVDVRFGHSLVDFFDDGQRVTCAVQKADGGGMYHLCSDYLVGADGGRSLVRGQLGIQFEGESGVVRPMMGGSMLSIYFRLEGGAERFNMSCAWQYWVLNPEIRALVLAIDGHERFCIHVKIPEDKDVKDIDQYELLKTAAGFDADFEIISAVPWRAGYCLLAEKLRSGRVFLAGDAAHLFTPTGGLGMNTGIEDVVNLSWKLAAVANGWAGQDLLDTYEEDRLPMAYRSLQYSRRFANSIGLMNVGESIEAKGGQGDAERSALKASVLSHAMNEFVIPGIVFGLNYSHSRLIVSDGTEGPEDTSQTYVPCARPGARAPHIWMDDGSSLFDHFGIDFTLLVIGESAPSHQGIEAAADRQRVPLKTVRVPMPEAADLYQASLALIGPDGHVLWRGSETPKSADALLARVRGETA